MAKLRFRKTFNLGGGVKITASKRGIGTSVGVKGFRVSHGADGRNRVTASIPKTGLSVQHTLGTKPRRPAARTPQNAPQQEPNKPSTLGALVLNLFFPGSALFAAGRPVAAILWLLLLLLWFAVKWDWLIGLVYLGSYLHYFLARLGVSTTPRGTPDSSP